MPEVTREPPSATAEQTLAAGYADTMSVPSSDFGAHVVMFWLLIAMAAIVFAPCILVPIWLETENLVRTEAEVAARTARLKAHVDEQVRTLKAMTSDPLVNERIARRDLRFRRAGEEVEPIQNQAPGARPEVETILASLPDDQESFLPEPPAVVTVTRRWLPDLPWVELFGHSPNRTIFMVMAGGMLVAAFVLYGQYGQTEPRRSNRDDTARGPA
jgi:cell division protein FtsB